MKLCKDRLHHKTEREALDHLAWARKQPQGYATSTFASVQVAAGVWAAQGAGSASERQLWLERKTAGSQPRPLTEGEARRKAERERKEAERHAQRAAHFEDYAESILILYSYDVLWTRELVRTAARKTKDHLRGR